MARRNCKQCKGTGFFYSRSLRGEMVCPCVLLPDEPEAPVAPVAANTPTGRPAVDSLAQFCGVTPAAFRGGAK
jgi:hypothetical protein